MLPIETARPGVVLPGVLAALWSIHRFRILAALPGRAGYPAV